MKNTTHKIVLALAVILTLVWGFGCINPQDTQRAADAHQHFEDVRAQAAADVAAGTITPEQATKIMADAIKSLGDELKAIGEDVKERTPFDWQGIVNSVIGGVLGFGATRITRGPPTKK